MLIKTAEDFVRQLLTENLPKGMEFHNLQHTLRVRDKAMNLANQSGLPPKETELLEIAALFHDTGYTQTYEGHEASSLGIAADFLRQHDCPEEDTARVLETIGATLPAKEPENLTQQILKDADLSNLASDHFLELAEKLRHEWKVFLGKEYSDIEWYKLNREFLKSTNYHTPAAASAFSEKKDANAKMLKKLYKTDPSEAVAAPAPAPLAAPILSPVFEPVIEIKEEKKKDAGEEKKKDKATNLLADRTAQMVFKTALRNHIDLTNLADNKSNIMISINAAMLTFGMPFLAQEIMNNREMLIPTVILFATCVAAIIFATMATRPVKTSGVTPLDKIPGGKTNLFFYGNFYKMNRDTYEEGMRVVLTNLDLLDKATIADLFYLGKALGEKFALLRTCYLVFMVGVTLAVASFAAIFLVRL